jgi:hypothetical protein
MVGGPAHYSAEIAMRKALNAGNVASEGGRSAPVRL